MEPSHTRCRIVRAQHVATSLTRRTFLKAAAAGAGIAAGGGLRSPAVRAQSPGGGGSLRFVWSPKSTTNPVFDVAWVGGLMRAGELGDIDFQWVGPPGADAQQQASLLDSVITEGCDGIGVSCNDAAVLQPIIDRATAAGIPVITWDSDSPSSTRSTYYSLDESVAATAGANRFIEVMAGHPARSYALLSGEAGSPNLDQRVAALRSVLDQTDLALVNTVSCDEEVQACAQAVEGQMGATPDIGGWFFVGGWPLFGGIDTMPQLAAAARSGAVKAVSWDTLPSQCRALVEGTVQGLIGQKYFGWGYDAVGILYDIVRFGLTVPPFVDSGFDLVTTTEQAEQLIDMWTRQDFRSGESPYGRGDQAAYG
jgi:ribose transport system substrate-binding protein